MRASNTVLAVDGRADREAWLDPGARGPETRPRAARRRPSLRHHRHEPAVGGRRGGGGAERPDRLGAGGLRDVHPSGRVRHRDDVAPSRGGRPLRVEPDGLRPLRRIHDRLDLLVQRPSLLPGPALLRGREPPVRGRRTGALLSTSSAYFIGFSLFGLALATLLNVFGLELGKWLNNIGGITRWLAMLGLIGIGGTAWASLGPATPITAGSLLPGLSLRDLVFFSLIAFAWTGPDGLLMGDEIQEPRRRARAPRRRRRGRRHLPAGTLSVLVAPPPTRSTGLQGIMQAMRRRRTAGPRLVTARGGLLMTSTGLAAWRLAEAVARSPSPPASTEPPAAFGRLHPRWGTPVNALLTRRCHGRVRRGRPGGHLGPRRVPGHGEHDFLVTFIPFLFTFAAAIKLATEPPGPGGWR